MEKKTQLFSKGMNKDSWTANREPAEYYDAENMRVMSEQGLSDGAIEILKGHKKLFSVLQLSSVYLITGDITGTSFVVDIAEDNIGTITYVPEGEQLTSIELFYQGLAETINTSQSYAQAQANGNGVVVYDPQVGTAILNVTVSGDLSISELIAPVQILEIIGATELRDSMVIFTADLQGLGSGQIWEITYPQGGDFNIRLVRNSLMNFDTTHQIEAVGRFETVDIRKVYWTDFYNPIRSINIDSPSSFLDVLSITPLLNFSIPKLISIEQGAGTLKEGHYQYAYRLRKLNGVTTEYSPFCNVVPILKASFDSTWSTYISNDVQGTSSKSITLEIELEDSGYDQIEIISLYKATATGLPVARRVHQAALNGESLYSYTDSGLTGDEIDLTLDEISLLSNVISHAKTLAIKDNRLFIANLKDTYAVIDYDATTYRYRFDGTTINDYPNTIDKINPYNRDSTRATTSALQHKYQQNTNILGGTGPNISYKFTGYELVASTKGSTFLPDTNFGEGINSTRDFNTLDLNGKTYNMGGLWRCFKNPFVVHHLTGYQRGEVYRFAIVFFDRSGRPSETKWIGDIRMPDHYDFPIFSENHDGETVVRVNTLGIEFTINITEEIRNLISGYSIVRLDRTLEDSTILAQGLVSEIADNINLSPLDRIVARVGASKIDMRQFDSPELKPVLDPNYRIEDLSGLKLKPCFSAAANSYAVIKHDVGYTFPASNNPSPIKQHGYAMPYYEDPRYYEDLGDTDNINLHSYNILKSQQLERWYDDATIFSNFLESGEDYKHVTLLNTAWASENLSIRLEGNHNNVLTAAGRTLPTDFFSSNGTVQPPYDEEILAWNFGDGERSIGPAPVIRRKLIANISRELNTQYGGNTATARTNNVYVSTGHYTSINDDSALTNTVKVFGGDTYIGIYDHIKTASGRYLNYADAVLATMGAQLVPVESRLNIDTDVSFAKLMTSITTDPIEDQFFDTVAIGKWTYGVTQTHRKFFSDPLDYKVQGIFDNRVMYSGVKINGEQSDSWTDFKSEDYYDVDGNHGPINKILTFNDVMYYWQDRGFGKLSINPRAVVSTEAGPTSLGNGATIDDARYISTLTGSKHQWSVVAGFTEVYWYDSLNNNFMAFGGQGTRVVSDLNKMAVYFNNIPSLVKSNDNPVGYAGLHCYYHGGTRELFITYNTPTESKTLIYDPKINAFVSFDTSTPKIYLGNRDRLISKDPEDFFLTLYAHNEGPQGYYYNRETNATIVVLINDHPLETKVWDNITLDAYAINGSGIHTDLLWKQLEVWNTYQHSGNISLSVGDNIKRVEREWQLSMPRNIVVETGNPNIFDYPNWDDTRIFKDRFRDKHLFVKFTLQTNGQVLRQYINYINIIFRISHR
jgi:hypothetical protein